MLRIVLWCNAKDQRSLDQSAPAGKKHGHRPARIAAPGKDRPARPLIRYDVIFWLVRPSESANRDKNAKYANKSALPPGSSSALKHKFSCRHRTKNHFHDNGPNGRKFRRVLF